MLVFLARLIFLAGAGFLTAFAHPFQWKDSTYQPCWWGWMIATLGLMIFMAVITRIDGKWKRFFAGFWAGLCFYGVTLYWIAIALHIHGEINWGISIFAAFSLSAYCSLYWGAWAAIAGSDWVLLQYPMGRVVSFASLWAGLEALRQYLFSGFHWGEIGYSFFNLPWIVETAQLWGVHGLTFFWIFIAALLLHLDSLWESRSQLRLMGLTCALLISIFLVSSILTHKWKTQTEFTNARVAIVQPNIEQLTKWDPNEAENHLKKLIALTREAENSTPDLIVWPETSFPFLVSAIQRQLPVRSNTPLLMGAVVKDNHVNRNSAILVNGDQIQERFDKQHLVPFGEYVPLKDWLPFGKLVANAGDFAPGSSDQKPIQPPSTPIRLGPLICYEDIFSANSVGHARHGANLLVNLTNDAWYGETSAQRQHTAMATLQTYQTFLPMIRATNNGWSGNIGPLEGIRMNEPFVEKVYVQELKIPTQSKLTFFAWSYPLMVWIWWVLFVMSILWKDPMQTPSLRRYPTKRIFFPKS